MTDQEFEELLEDLKDALKEDPTVDNREVLLKGMLPAVQVGIFSLDQGDRIVKELNSIPVRYTIHINMDD